MTGAELRMRRLFGKESGRAYVVAIDHGMLFGVQEGSEDAIGAVARSLASSPDGLFISPGLLARTGHLLAHRGAASPIVRLDYLTLDERTRPYGDKHRVLCSPAQAAKLGADAVVMYLMLGAADGETFADNLTAIGQALGEVHELGLPLIAESVDALLATTRDALLAGAAGVIYGRNIWQADDPAEVGAAVRSLVHEQR